MQTPIYLDYAATTPLRKEVRERFTTLLQEPFGNPSSTHGYGRKARVVVEEARKAIARELNCQPGELVFTSGGTEADNAALSLAITDLGFRRIITSPIEHHAVLHAAQRLAKTHAVPLDYVQVNARGEVDLEHLETLLKQGGPAVVSLMHGNNEIGNLLDLEKTGHLVHRYGGVFHSDTVQTVAHFKMDLQKLPVDFIAASAHKFYGPKGVGFLYIKAGHKVGSFITGGSQERNLRGGTENVAGIGAMHQAFTLAYQNLAVEQAHVEGLKSYLIEQLQKHLPETRFNGLSSQLGRSLYTVVSAEFPQLANDAMLLFNLDLKGIALSGGSACSSGSLQGSHVINTLKPTGAGPVLRFSMGKDTTRKQLDYVVQVLKDMEG
jgi:cysteine desulfurase